MGLYLVTRLIGYTRADCLRLVDNSLAARWRDGPFLLHTGPSHNDEGYRTINEGMRRANEILTSRHLTSILSTGDEFPGDRKDLMGYYSWGSNDLKFKKRAYNSLVFAPGGIAETAVSTSARTFADPNAPGQSLIADLVAQGVTGCKGYVSEPGIMAMARADILFDRYTVGFNLAESFYSASWRIHGKDMIIGDPICAPYSNQQSAHAVQAPRPATLHAPGVRGFEPPTCRRGDRSIQVERAQQLLMREAIQCDPIRRGPGRFLNTFLFAQRLSESRTIDVRPIAEEEVKATGWDRSEYAGGITA